MRLFHNLRHSIRNIIYWFPVIWKDHNWDYSFLLIILRHKLKAMRLSAVHWGWTGHEEALEDIESAINIIDVLSNDEFAFTADQDELIGALFGVIRDNIQAWWS